jgi:hypothetical protein
MKLSKQRKLSLGLLAVALSALAADRIFLGAASPASASAGEVGPAAPVSAGIKPTTKPAGPSLATRLESIASLEGLESGGVADVFAMPETPVKWRLTTTFGTGPGASIVIDGLHVRIGQQHGGAELVSVGPEGALFRRDGQEFFVKIGGTSGGANAPDAR